MMAFAVMFFAMLFRETLAVLMVVTRMAASDGTGRGLSLWNKKSDRERE